MVAPDYVLMVNGTYGVGKSSVLDHLGDLLAARGRPFSLMDVDWFHRSWPPADDDPENVNTEAENVAGVWARYRSSGPRQAVLSGIVATASDCDRYEQAFALPLRIVRLEASPEVIEVRLRARYGHDRSTALSWHLTRHRDVARQLALTHLAELVVHTDDLSARAVAENVLAHFNLT